MLGGVEAEPAGFDLRGAFVGSEGTMGIATRMAVTITPNPPAVQTMLLGFATVEAAANTVSAVIAAGIVPAAMEVMDRKITEAVESFVGAGYPTDAAAVLLAEVDGFEHGTTIDADRIVSIGRANGATSVKKAQSEQERELLWKGRKTAFGAIAQIAPDYYLHDTVVPRSKLAEVLEQIYEIADRGFRIVGVFDSKLQQYEEGYVFAGEGTIQELLGVGDAISEVAILGHDYRNVDGLHLMIAEAAGPELEVLPWHELDSYLGTMLAVMDGFVVVWIVVVFLALSFGLVNTLVMAVFERVREIGLMLALGMTPRNILSQILAESILLLVIGLAIGNLAAWATIEPLKDGIDISIVAEVLHPFTDDGVLRRREHALSGALPQ